MFNLYNFPNVVNHLKSISTIFKDGKWIQMFCPFCGDAVRKPNPAHGHLYVCKTFPYFLCFRCNESGSLIKLLKRTNFSGDELDYITRLYGNIHYSSNNLLVTNKNTDKLLYDKLNDISNNFKDNYPDQYRSFLTYMANRIGSIDHIRYLAIPSVINNTLACNFYNFDGDYVISRAISQSQLRFLSKNANTLYYFQDSLLNIDEYENIVLAEGPFDIINVFNFLPQFNKNNSFYISIQSSLFIKTIKQLISTYLLINTNRYTFHVITDKDNYNKQLFIKNVNIKLYQSKITKDVAEIPSIKEI